MLCPDRDSLRGIHCEGKGISVLLEACALLAKVGYYFRLEMMGHFEDPIFGRDTREKAARQGIWKRVKFLGALSGHAKKAAFRQAHIFCFLTFYENETIGVVLFEAMFCGLPVVTTRWRGVPSVVQDGMQGFLGPIKDAGAMAEPLVPLIQDAGLREKMGRAGAAAVRAGVRICCFPQALG